MSNAGPIATGLAIAAVPVVAGIAVYLAKMGAQAKIDGLEGDTRRLKDKIDSLETSKRTELDQSAERFVELEARYSAVLQTRALLQSQLDLITANIADIAMRLNAKDYSILVPAPTMVPGDRPHELVFLCASGPQGAKLRSVRVPIETSMSGQVFLSGSATIASPAQNGTTFSQQTDKVAEYQTDETLCACLYYRGDLKGVAQFVNKRGGRFNGQDVERAVELSNALSTLVGEFVSDPAKLGELGYSPRRNDFSATIMFVDLSGYSRLFDHLDNSVVNDILNQYFEALGNIALSYNAVIDQFIGDGMLIIFGGIGSAGNHQTDAVDAALKMVTAFATLRQRWATIQYRGTETLFVRLGLSTGPVTRTEIGHRQFRRLTVLGAVVNEAALTCEQAPRGRDTICLSRSLRDRIAYQASPVGEARHGVYELRV
ncbi:adenylate/guanylate cyclase domain-containing protein [Novosphingobium sp. BL-52-GroH]|uniref:adenylate/guanylate cyclase domain-containing protein n=1 Tax=Novosphingobium sp. BL-52-GroH TaxID=3349877 RepID=UPI00384F9BE8